MVQSTSAVWDTTGTHPPCAERVAASQFWSATIRLSVRELAEAFLGRNCAGTPGASSQVMIIGDVWDGYRSVLVICGHIPDFAG